MAIDATKYPVLSKMEDVHGESQVVGEFLEWLKEQGMTVCEPSEFATMPWMPVRQTTEALLARYFEVDLVAAERERRAVLDEFRAATQP